MLCEHCHGTGQIRLSPHATCGQVRFPCPDCGGTGRVHCCGGEQAQPEADTDDPYRDVGGEG